MLVTGCDGLKGPNQCYYMSLSFELHEAHPFFPKELYP